MATLPSGRPDIIVWQRDSDGMQTVAASPSAVSSKQYGVATGVSAVSGARKQRGMSSLHR